MEAGGVVCGHTAQHIQKPGGGTSSYNIAETDSQQLSDVTGHITNSCNKQTKDNEITEQILSEVNQLMNASESSIVEEDGAHIELLETSRDVKIEIDKEFNTPSNCPALSDNHSTENVIRGTGTEPTCTVSSTGQTFESERYPVILLEPSLNAGRVECSSSKGNCDDEKQVGTCILESHAETNTSVPVIDKLPIQSTVVDHSDRHFANNNANNSRTRNCSKRDAVKSRVSLRGVKYFDDSSDDNDDDIETCNDSKNNRTVSIVKPCSVLVPSSQHPDNNKKQLAYTFRKPGNDSSTRSQHSSKEEKRNTKYTKTTRTTGSVSEKLSNSQRLYASPSNASRNKVEKNISLESVGCKVQRETSTCVKYGLRRLAKKSPLLTDDNKREKLHVTEEECFKVIGLEGIKCRFCKKQLRKNYQSLYHVRGLCKKKEMFVSNKLNSTHLKPTDAYWSSKKLQMRKKLLRHRSMLSIQARLVKCYIRLDRISKYREQEKCNEKPTVSSSVSTVSSRRVGIIGAVNGGVIYTHKSGSEVSSDQYCDSIDSMGNDCSFADTNSTNVQVIASTTSPVEETPAVPCVCDGCGEIVPDCAWLTAHITNCRAGTERNDDVVTNSSISSADGAENSDLQTFKTENVIVNSQNELPVKLEAGVLTAVNSDVSVAAQVYDTTDTTASLQQQFDANTLLQYLETNTNLVEDISAPNSFTGNETDMNALQFSFDEFGENTLSYIGKEITYEGAEMYEFIEYECDTCLLTLLNRRAALQHLQNSDHSQATVLIVYVYCCKHCTLRFRLKQDMWFHVMYLCQFASDSNIPQSLTSSEDKSSYYNCSVCSKSFYAMHFLRRHMFLYHSPVVTGQVQTMPACGISSQTPDNPSSSQMNGWSQELGADLTQPNIGGIVPQASTDLSSDPQTLLDLACSMVLASPSVTGSNNTNKVNDSQSVADVMSTSSTVDSCATLDMSALSKQQEISKTISHQPMTPASTEGGEGQKTRRCAKGIVYKNVFMKCVVNYLCSICNRDLSTKASKKEHKSSACFESPGVRRFTYVRHYSYLCPYCGEKFPTQKFCRQHQLTRCLLIMGVKTDELNFKQLLCPFCDKKYFNIITLKGHMTLVHKMDKYNGEQQNAVNSQHQNVSASTNSDKGTNFSVELLNENSNISSDDAGFSMADCEDNSIG